MRKKMLAGIVAGALMAGAGFGILSGQAQASEAAVQNGRTDRPPVMRGHRGGELGRAQGDAAVHCDGGIAVGYHDLYRALHIQRDREL